MPLAFYPAHNRNTNEMDSNHQVYDFLPGGMNS